MAHMLLSHWNFVSLARLEHDLTGSAHPCRHRHSRRHRRRCRPALCRPSVVSAPSSGPFCTGPWGRAPCSESLMFASSSSFPKKFHRKWLQARALSESRSGCCDQPRCRKHLPMVQGLVSFEHALVRLDTASVRPSYQTLSYSPCWRAERQPRPLATWRSQSSKCSCTWCRGYLDLS